MLTMHKVWSGIGCGSLVLALATGCDDNGDNGEDRGRADVIYDGGTRTGRGADEDAGMDASVRSDGGTGSSLDASSDAASADAASADAASADAARDAAGDAARDAAGDAAGDAAIALTEAQVVGIVTTINTGEVEAGTLAQTKGSGAGVINFASMMVAMHQAANTRAAALGITPASSPPMTELMTMSAMMKATLTSLPQGAEFDRVYLRGQVDMHRLALDTFDRILLPNATTPALVAELTRARGEVQMHLTQAQALVAGLDGGT